MISINPYIFLSILSVTAMSMFLNIYSTIKVFNLINEDEKERHEEEIETLEVDNMMYREEIIILRKSCSAYQKTISELDQKLGIYAVRQWDK